MSFNIYDKNHKNSKYTVKLNENNDKWILRDNSNNSEYEINGNTIAELKNIIKTLENNEQITFKLYSKHENKDPYFTDYETIGHGWRMSQYDKDLANGIEPKMEPYIYKYECDCNDNFQLFRMFNLNYEMFISI